LARGLESADVTDGEELMLLSI